MDYVRHCKIRGQWTLKKGQRAAMYFTMSDIIHGWFFRLEFFRIVVLLKWCDYWRISKTNWWTLWTSHKIFTWRMFLVLFVDYLYFGLSISNFGHKIKSYSSFYIETCQMNVIFRTAHATWTAQTPIIIMTSQSELQICTRVPKFQYRDVTPSCILFRFGPK